MSEAEVFSFYTPQNFDSIGKNLVFCDHIFHLVFNTVDVEHQNAHAITAINKNLHNMNQFLVESFNDINWKNNKNGDIEQKIRVFLGQWKKLADQVPEELRSQIIDLS